MGEIIIIRVLHPDETVFERVIAAVNGDSQIIIESLIICGFYWLLERVLLRIGQRCGLVIGDKPFLKGSLQQ